MLVEPRIPDRIGFGSIRFCGGRKTGEPGKLFIIPRRLLIFFCATSLFHLLYDIKLLFSIHYFALAADIFSIK